MRAPFVLLLLLHYLLTGVLGGTMAELTRPAAPSAAHPYAHSVDCQRHNYLRLDCFDSCNGKQHTLKALAKGLKDHHQSTVQKQALDSHVLLAPLVLPQPHGAWVATAPQATPRLLAAVAGYFLLEGPPPEA